MLKLRVITALIIAPIVIALIFLAPGWLFAAVMLAMALAGAWEWSALAGRPARATRIEMVGLFLALIALFVLAQPRSAYVQGMILYCSIALAWWIFSLVWIAKLRTEFSFPVKTLCGVLTILPSLAAVVAIRAVNPWYLLILLLLTSAADIGAYFAGR
ncbi:MAG TPA: phosphatidate cytidylyltransferase, partial [Gammaproteobacteria bacterium]|nr:phosphatidate cytidylyltransferase [Gammaproteobacteria bacterium]